MSIIQGTHQVEGGRTILQKTVRESAYSEKSKNGEQPGAEGNALCQEAYEKAAEEATHYVSPYQAVVSLEFHDIEDGGATEKAVAMAKVSNFEEAKTVLAQVAQDQNLPPKDQAWAKYNLAVVLWALADFTGCIDELKGAQNTIGSDSSFTGMYRQCKEYLQ